MKHDNKSPFVAYNGAPNADKDDEEAKEHMKSTDADQTAGATAKKLNMIKVMLHATHVYKGIGEIVTFGGEH